MEIQGKIIAALPERSGVSARGEWKSQDFVLETLDGQFARKMMFTVFGADRLARFNIQIGQDVLVAFDINAREWNGRWFNDVRAYDVRPAVANDAVSFGQPAAVAQPAQVQPAQQAPVADAAQTVNPGAPADPFDGNAEGADNLPF